MPDGAFVAVAVRRLVPRTGIGDLLDAWALAAPRLPPGAVLLVGGDGPLAGELAARAATIGEREARMLGALSDEALLAAYRAADVAVVPTRSHEGFGLVVLEAAGCGTPSIVTDVDALPEVARPLDGSLVVAAGDTPALAGRLVAASRGELPARAAVREYAERFSWAAVAAAHERLYRRVLDRAAPSLRRVVILDHVARLSGGEIALLRLLPHLEGVEPHVILGEDGPLAARLQQAGISVEVLPLAAGGPRPAPRRRPGRGRAARHSARDAALHAAPGPAAAASVSGPRAHQLAEGGRLRRARGPAGRRARPVAPARPDRRGLPAALGDGRARAGSCRAWPSASSPTRRRPSTRSAVD